jgi:hypothetical protein
VVVEDESMAVLVRTTLSLRRQRRGGALEVAAVDHALHDEAGLHSGAERPKLGLGQRPVEDAVVAAASR